MAKTKTQSKPKTLKVTLRKSVIGEKPKTRATVEALGLRKINSSREHTDSETLRGMLAKVQHLVEVEEV